MKVASECRWQTRTKRNGHIAPAEEGNCVSGGKGRDDLLRPTVLSMNASVKTRRSVCEAPFGARTAAGNMTALRREGEDCHASRVKPPIPITGAVMTVRSFLKML